VTRNRSLTDVPPAMLAATRSALDAGIVSQDQVTPHVLAHMGGFHCVPALRTEITLVIDGTTETWHPNRQAEEALSTEIRRAPRGSYALLHSHRRADTHRSRRAIVSDGTGDLAPGGLHDSFDGVSGDCTGVHVVSRRIGSEGSLGRKAVEAQHTRDRNQHAIQAHRLSVGSTHHGRFRLSPHTSSFVPFTGLDHQVGTVTLRLTRRGSPTRDQATIDAAQFVHAAGLQDPTSPVPHARQRLALP
jgi:hypothetical protein